MAGIFLPGSSKGASGDITAVVAGDGLSGGATDGSASIALDLNELTGATVAVANDSIAIIDADDDGSKKESIADLVSGIAGTNISASSGQLSVADSAAGTKGIVIVAGGDGASVSYSSGTATVAVDLGTNSGLEIDSNKLQIAKGISQHDVAQFAASVADDDFLRIDGTTVEGLSAAEVAAAIEGSIDAVGTIATGTWEATDVAVAHGGTGASTLTANGVLIGNGTSAITSVAMATKGHILIGDGSGNPQMLSVGSNDQVLTADTGETTGVKWADAGGGGGTLTIDAKEDLSAGEPVALVNDSGTMKVEPIKGISESGSQYNSSTRVEHTLGQHTYTGPRALFFNGTVWIDLFCPGSEAGDDLSNYYVYGKIGSYNASTNVWTWGTTVALTSASSYPVAADWDPDTSRIVFTYSPSGGTYAGVAMINGAGNAIVIADSGSDYAPGTHLQVDAGTVGNALCLIYDKNGDKAIINYQDAGDSNYGKTFVGTITGGSTNTIAQAIAPEKNRGSNVAWNRHDFAFDQDNGIGMILFKEGSSMKCIAFTHNGSAFTWGAETEPFGSSKDYYINLKNGKVNNNYGGADSNAGNIVWDPGTDNFVAMAVGDDGDSDDTAFVVAITPGTISDNSSLTLGTVVSPFVSSGVALKKADGTAMNIATVNYDNIILDGGASDPYQLSEQNGLFVDPDLNKIICFVGVNHSEELIDWEYEGGHIGPEGQCWGATLTLGGTGNRTVTIAELDEIWKGTSRWGAGVAMVKDHPMGGFVYDSTNNIALQGWNGIWYTEDNSGNSEYVNWLCATVGATSTSERYQVSNMKNFIGFNTAAVDISTSASATITVKGGLNENQSNLTVGQKYWIGDGGTLVPKKPFHSLHLYTAGIATAATKLLVLNDFIPYGGH